MESGASVFSSVDAHVKGSLTDLSFVRSYISTDNTWLEDGLLMPQGFFMPTPFGASPSNPRSLRWTENYFSFVTLKGFNTDQAKWVVRDPNGYLEEFKACTDLQSQACFAAPLGESTETSDKLHWTPASGGSFTLYREGVGRFIFADKWSGSFGGAVSGDDDHYFLTRIERYASQSSSGQGKTVAKLTYAVPATCGEEVPGLNVGVDGNPGAPYLASVENEDGTKLLFHYTLLPSTASPTGHECVLSGVQLQDAAGFQSAVDYQYEAQSAGLLSRATLGSDLDFGTQPHVESYAYTTSLGPGFSVYQDFGLQTEHPENAAGHATAAKGPYEEYSFNDPQTVADCGETDNASYCLPGGGLMTRTATNTRSMVGDGVLRAS